MQYKQDARNVVSYATFRRKIDCMLRTLRRCRTWRADGRTSSCSTRTSGWRRWAIGSRGRVARDVIAHRGGPHCVAGAEPCGALGAISALTSAYGKTVGAYAARSAGFGGLSPRVRGDDRHDRARIHGHVLESRQALRHLHDRLRRSAPVQAVTLRRRSARVRGPGSASAPPSVYVATSAQGVQRGVHVGPAQCPPERPGRPAQRRRLEPQGAADAARDRARADARSGAAGRRRSRTCGRSVARDARADRVRDEPAGVRLGLAARGRGPVQRHLALLHALPEQAGREPRDPGRGESGRVDRAGRQRDRAVAAAGVDELDLPDGVRSERPLRLQRHRDDGRQPRGPRVRRAERDHPARVCRETPRVPLHRQCRVRAGRGPGRVPLGTRSPAGFPGAGAVGRRRSLADGAARGRGGARRRVGESLEDDYLETALVADLPFPVDRAPGGLRRDAAERGRGPTHPPDPRPPHAKCSSSPSSSETGRSHVGHHQRASIGVPHTAWRGAAAPSALRAPQPASSRSAPASSRPAALSS